MALNDGLSFREVLTPRIIRATELITPVVLTGELELCGHLQGIAYHAEGMARRERARIQAEDPALVSALREGLIAEPLVDRAFAIRRQSNLIMDAGKGFLCDAWQGITTLSTMKFHANGTGTLGNTDPTMTALQTEILTTNPASQRATGTTVEGTLAKVFRTVGQLVFTNTPISVTEWGLFSAIGPPATAPGVMFSRVSFAAIVLNLSGDAIQWTYECTLG